MDKIICVGRNYLAHAKEMGGEVPTEPMLFLKPPSSIFRLGQYESLSLPKHLGEIHHELELVFKVKKEKGREPTLCAWTIGLDLTARELQAQLKSKGHPWERAKAFENSAITGEFLSLPMDLGYLDIPFELYVNEQLRQKGLGKDMKWKPEEILKEAATAFHLKDGDLIFTGTPEGVGPLKTGDRLHIKLGSLLEHTLDIL